MLWLLWIGPRALKSMGESLASASPTPRASEAECLGDGCSDLERRLSVGNDNGGWIEVAAFQDMLLSRARLSTERRACVDTPLSVLDLAIGIL